MVNVTAEKIIELLENAGGFISGERMAEQLEMSRSAIWKNIEELRNLGYVIESVKGEGYNLKSRPDLLLPCEVNRFLNTEFMGRRIDYYDIIDSTTKVARNMCLGGNHESLNGTVIVAEEQTGGVGRLGRAWSSPRGGLWISIILTPKINMDHLFTVTMAASIAIVRAIKKETGIGSLIKWPNDIYIGDRKVGGLLVEISAEADRINYCILGIGIDVNVLPEDFPDDIITPITSIFAETGNLINRAGLLARILREFEQRYRLLEEEEYTSIITEWKSLSLTLDKRVQIKTLKKTYTGVAIDIDGHGALIIRKDNGKIERCISGDIIRL